MDPVNTELRLEATSDALEMVQSAIDLEKPVITAMSGVAHGGGLAFSLLCDILIVEEHVTIRDGHVLAGIAAGDGGTLIWPAAIGLSRAKRYLLTGDPISAQEAVEFGLAAECVERGESLTRALEFATRFAAGPQLAIQSTKRALNQLLRAASTTSFYYSWALELVTLGSPDSVNAVDALGRRLAGPMPSDPRAGR